jgi:hypothetical protein
MNDMHVWEDNIKIDLTEVGWGGTRTGLIWFTIGCWVGSCEGGDEPLISITCREFLV